jgi:hypothetical protein
MIDGIFGVYGILVEKSQEEIIDRARCKLLDNIDIYVRKNGYKDVNWLRFGGFVLPSFTNVGII